MLFSMRKLVLAGALLLGAVVAGDVRAQDVSNADLVKAFAGVALGSEHEKRIPRVIKWTDPINIAVIGKGYPRLFEKLILETVGTLTKVSGHPVNLVYSDVMRREKRLSPNVSKIPINVLVFYAPKKDLPAMVEKRTKGAFKAADTKRMTNLGFCHGRMRIKKTGALRFAYVAVPAEITTRVDYGKVKVNPDLFLRACVIEEITQVMGLINDVPGLSFSIFSDDSAHVDMTDADKWLLRLLYDKRMTPGMLEAQAVPTAAKILSEIRPGK